MSGNAYGGWSLGNANASNNTVNVSGGATIGTTASSTGNVFGGWSEFGAASSNTVNITNATVRGIVFGGWVNGGSGNELKNNSVFINSGAILRGNLYGAYSQGNSGTLSGNKVIIDGGSIAGTPSSPAIIAGAYSAIGSNTVSNNSVTLESGTINNASIYGGRGQSGSPIIGNSVAIIGGTIVNGVIFGGQNINGAGTVDGNTVTITGGNVQATIYGGYSGGSGDVTNNAVSISDALITGNIYGGYSARGSVTNNTITYGVSNANDVITFGGAILGASSLTKVGDGTLILTNDSSIDGGVRIEAGTLQLGNGGVTGNITSSYFFFPQNAAVLAFQHSNDVTMTQPIAGNGKVIQRGTGTLTLQNLAPTAYYFTGGTEIESGGVRIVDDISYSRTASTVNFASIGVPDANYGTHSGYITFTGADTAQEKKLVVDYDGPLRNSFRTQAGAGPNNYVDLTAASVQIADVFIADPGGAFFVAGGTTMNVDVKNNLLLALNLANFQWNDLYVENGGTFNLNLKSSPASTLVTFASGINGEGTLNITGDGTARFQIMGSSPFPLLSQTFHMGTTNVYGDGQAILSLLRPTTDFPRVNFTNTDAFNLGNGNGSPLSAILLGDGIVSANTINVNSGALAPAFLPTMGPGTLTLQAPTINLTDFALLYMAYGSQGALTFGADGIPNSNNDLLNLNGTVNLESGKVYFVTADGAPFPQESFLVIRSNVGFDGIGDDAELNRRLTAYVDGFVINTAAGSPRGGGGLSFLLGGDPNTTGQRTDGTNNVWFTNNLNSLTMDWTGGSTITAGSGSWESGPFFSSLQTNDAEHENYFMTGDKVHISGNNTFTIDLPAETLASKIVVSGLVVGQDSNGNTYNSGHYTISGAGGIRADVNTAFGQYVNDGTTEELVPTGMLQKYGNSTLTFTNTGGNFFAQGIELYGGTIAFNRADQLGIGDTAAITFKGNATLQSNANVALGASQNIVIDGPGTSGTFNTNGYTAGIAGVISGDGALIKTGAGTLILTGDNTYSGGTTVSQGILQIGDGGATGSITGNILNNANVAFNRSDTLTYGGVLSGTGSLTKDGAGTLTLTGANAYTGLTEVRGGTLALSGAGSISDTLALYGGTTFDTGGAPVNYLSRLDVLGPAHWTGDLNMGMAGKIMSFHLPGDIMQTGVSMLTVAGSANIEASTVNMNFTGAIPYMNVGDKIILIDSNEVLGKPANATVRAIQGVTLQYDFSLITTFDQLLATVIRRGLSEQTKALSEGFLNGLILVNQGGDLIAGQGMAQAMNAVDEKRGYGLGTFGILSGGWSRYDTGSHADMSSLSLMTGLSFGADLAPGRLTLAAFFEYGNGSYTTYNSFNTAASVHGEGEVSYLGGGILGRMDFIDAGPGHIYAEGSIRTGGVHNGYNSSLRDSLNRRANYEAFSAYYGAHAGLGYVWNITDKASFDFYGKYFWARQRGDSVTLSTGDPVKFKDADSSRLRLGGRVAYAANEYVSPYIGIAWEREFDGKARAAAYGYDIDEPSLRGDTGIGELGLSLKPSLTLPLSINLSMQGYVGKREGVTGSLQIRYEF